RRLQHAGLFSAQISEHHVGSAHEQPTALTDAVDALETMLDPWQQAADGSRLEVHRRVDGKRRRRLGGAVAFEDPDAELLEPHPPRLGLHALGAGEYVAHRV